MYTLKEIGSDSVITHDYLGYGFSVVNKETSPEYFYKSYCAYLGDSDNVILKEEVINEEIFGFVISEGGREIFPLYKNRYYYIVTENGKTLNNLTFK